MLPATIAIDPLVGIILGLLLFILGVYEGAKISKLIITK